MLIDVCGLLVHYSLFFILNHPSIRKLEMVFYSPQKIFSMFEVQTEWDL